MNSREKGKRGEREAAAALRALGVEARRGQQYSGDPDSPDVLAAIQGVHLEVKRTERLRLYEAMAQAIRDAGPDKYPVLLSKRNHGAWLATVRLDDLPFIASALRNAMPVCGCDWCGRMRLRYECSRRSGAGCETWICDECRDRGV